MDEEFRLPNRVQEKFKTWNDAYSVERLKEWSLKDLQSEQYKFEGKVEILKTEFKRGRLVTPEMAEAIGKEPLTHEELRKIRRRIDDEADKIRSNFKVAVGKKEAEEATRKQEFMNSVKEAFEAGRDFVFSILLLLQKIFGR